MTVKTAKKQCFSASNIAALTGLSVPRIDQLIGLGTVVLSPSERLAEGSGNHRRMELPTVYQFAFVAALIKLGIPSKQAAGAAQLFAMDQPGRPANTLYEFGRTLSITDASGSRIVNSQFDDALIDLCGRPFASALIVDIGQIIQAIDSALTNISRKENS